MAMLDKRSAASKARCMIVIDWRLIVTKTSGIVISVREKLIFPDRLNFRLGRDREPSPIPERLRRNLDSRSRLLPLVFAALHHSDHPTHQLRIKIVSPRNLFS